MRVGELTGGLGGTSRLDVSGDTMDWSQTKPMDSADFHSRFGGQEWRYTDRGIFLRSAPDTPLRTHGEPDTCNAILSIYGQDIFNASMTHGVPPELIVMTIATESAADRPVNFTGPRTFRWEPGVQVTDVSPQTMGDYSAGPMQTLATTARDIIRRLHLPHDPFGSAPYFATQPVPAPASNPLYGGALNIDLGAAEIKSRLGLTGLDPILVAAAYNSGGLRETDANVWRLRTQGDHLDRASKWFGDACFILAALRRGAPASAAAAGSQQANQGAATSHTFDITGLTIDEAEEESEFYIDSGAEVGIIIEPGDLRTLRITYPDSPPPVPTPLPSGGVGAPDRNGYVLCIDRIRTERRPSAGFSRTVGAYQAYFDRNPIPEISGFCVERQGPGDNTPSGVDNHRRIAAGTYPLFAHQSPLKNGIIKYKTLGFNQPRNFPVRPWPCLGVESTGARGGILIHCAKGYLMSTGCINLSASVTNASTDLDFADSRRRVIALIDSIKARIPNFPDHNGPQIPSAFLIVRNEP